MNAQKPSKHDLPLFQDASPEVRRLARQARAEKRAETRALYWPVSYKNPNSPNYDPSRK